MIGETVSHYRIDQELGSGGMGVVYRALDTRLGRAVALKFLPPQLGRDPSALERFRREARAASALNHPNICTVHDIGESGDGRQFIVMELLEGETLQTRLRRGPLPLAAVLELGLEAAAALEAAHARGIVHRDLKPANLFLTQGGQAKVLDFGLAKILPSHAAAQLSEDAPTVADAPPVSELTQVGSAMGTVAYMSPEQARGAPVDARSDLFSLGVVLYEAATGKGAFPGATSAVIFDGILNRTPDLRAVASPELVAVLQKALEKDPGLRYQTAADLRADLRRLIRDSESGHTAAAIAPAPPPTAQGSRRLLLASLALAALALVATAAWYYLRPAPMLRAKDTVVLADFANSTGDAMFNGALRQGLAAQLEQTPFFNLVSDEGMAATEKLMALAPGTPIVGAVARQLCQRTSSAAAIEGSIAQVGTQYSLVLNAVNCTSGDNLASVAETAAGKDEVLAALGKAASALRAKLGESLASMRQFNTPIEQVTTPSLDALHAYTLGRQALTAGDNPSAINLFGQAVGLDTNFAMAYASLSTADMNQHPPATAAAIAAIGKAYGLRDRVSQRERFYITARHDDTALGDELQTERDYDIWKQTYPNDAIAFGNDCVTESNLGQNAASLADCQAAVQRAPDNTVFLVDLEGSYFSMHRDAESRAVMARALGKMPASVYLHESNYLFARDSADHAGMAAELAWVEKQGKDPGFLVAMEALDAMEGGQLGRLGQLEARLRALTPATDKTSQAADVLALAQSEAVMGQRAEAARDAEAGLEISRDPATLDAAAGVLAMTGPADEAEKVIAELERAIPPNHYYRLIDIPTDRALLALARKQPQAAVDLLAPVEPYDLGLFASGLPAYVRGLALLDLHRGAEAAAEFQKVVDSRLDSGVLAPAELGLARAQAMAGSTAAARASYQKLLAHWEHADPGLPAVVAARAEAAALR